MIGFLLLTLFPPFDPLVHPCPSLLIGCTYHGSSHFPTLHVLFRGPPSSHHLRLILGISLFCAHRHTPPFGLTLIVDIVLVQFIFSLSWSRVPSAPPLGFFLIANSQIYLVWSGRALIRSTCLPCVCLPPPDGRTEHLVV